MPEEYCYVLIQDGVEVAKVVAPSREQALREIYRYARVYGQDGPCEIKEER